MATPMRAFREIAARYGVDPTDKDAVDVFYEVTVQGFDFKEQQAIFGELFSRDGEPEGEILKTVGPVRMTFWKRWGLRWTLFWDNLLS